MLVRETVFDRLRVEVYSDRATLGLAAAQRVALWMRILLAERERVCMVFAAAPSQNEFLAELVRADGVNWGRVVALHMDEYVGLPAGAPQSFGRFLRERLFDVVRPGEVHLIDGNAATPELECVRYAHLLETHPPDIVCAGIGENGHLAFNDPWVADFDDPLAVKVVELDERCRAQQVHDGCFSRIEDVPARAITLALPALLRAPLISCVVPGPTKAQAVRDTLLGPVTTDCPASILRRHLGAHLYLDLEAASLLP